MNVLIICDAFPPDTIIGGVRPFMMAKYLTSFGHHVTVINSGRYYSKLDDRYNSDLQKIEILSVYRTAVNHIGSKATNTRRPQYPGFVKSAYRSLKDIVNIIKGAKTFNDIYHKQREIIDRISERHFDVVFSTYSPLSSIYAGEYAAKKFHCKWIMDFRDALIQPDMRSWLWNHFYLGTQKHAVANCDVCTVVSNGVGKMVSFGTKGASIYTLYNGYDEIGIETDDTSSRYLSFCYTGNIYGSRMKAMRRIMLAISKLRDEKLIEIQNIQLNYAGGQSDILLTELSTYRLESILSDNGYLSVTQCDQLQKNSDIFLILSWNTKNEQGILTGKFFEGIRAKRTMLASVVGNEPHCELAELNEVYHYGFCDEESSGDDSIENLCHFIKKKYDEKMSTGSLKYEQNSRLTEKFKYENLAKELETLCLKMLE